MPRFSFENKITLSGVIQIGLLLLAAIGAYYGIISRVDGNDRDIASLRTIASSVPDLTGRVSTIETRINIGQQQREEFQDKTEASLERLASQNAQIMAQLAAIIARMDEADRRR